MMNIFRRTATRATFRVANLATRLFAFLFVLRILIYVNLYKVFKPDDLINRTYVTERDEEGQSFRAKIVEKIIERDHARDNDPAKIKFLVRMEGDKADEIISYHQALDYVTEEIDKDLNPDRKIWQFEEIVGHQHVSRGDGKAWKGSPINVMIRWKDGSQTYEPLKVIAEDDPV